VTFAVFRPGAFLLLVALATLAFSVVVIVDMARHPTWQWQRARSNKALWIVLQVIGAIFGFLIAIIVGILYFAMIRPRLEVAAGQGPPPGYWPGGPAGGWGGAGPGPWGSPGGGPGPWGSPGGGPGPWGSPGGGAPGTGPAPSGPATPEPTAGSTPPAYPSAPAPPERYGSAPAAPTQPSPPFGWYPDPSARHEQRYWDGTRWTEHVNDGGVQSTDPLPG